jgi:hypothetical protein
MSITSMCQRLKSELAILNKSTNRLFRNDCLQHLQSNRAIDQHTSDADAQSRTYMSIIVAALLTMSVASAHAVKDAHHSPTSGRIASSR